MKRQSRFALWLMALSVVSLPAATQGDTVKVTDGSILKGRVIQFVRDTLSVESTFGGVLRIPRSRIAWISFGDSVMIPPDSEARWMPPSDPGVAPAGADGELGVTFKNNEVSSKIVVTKKRDLPGCLSANFIEQLLLVDGDTAFSYVDTVMDKTIFRGPDRVYKNSIELKDMFVKLRPGSHYVTLVVRNLGRAEYEDRFEGEPLDVEFEIGDVQLYPGRPARVHVGISTGKLRMGKPRFYIVN